MCMGNTNGGRLHRGRRQVHPHVYGEYLSQPHTSQSKPGPSPCVWGIPPSYLMTQRHQVHPHVYGEYSVSKRTDHCSLRGPSPCVWGIHLCQHGFTNAQRSIPMCMGIQGYPVPAPLDLRSIPMCMGNTQQRETPCHFHWVHPHVYGKYFAQWLEDTWIEGPSPCVWGIHNPPRATSGARRSIPMCMGNTLR